MQLLLLPSRRLSSSPSWWAPALPQREELGRRANEDIEHVLEGCQDDKQITLLSVLHCWGRNSPSRVHGHLLAWLELASAQAGHQVGKLAAQLMTYQLLGPGLLDLWLELTTELASELSEANRAAALCNCSLLDDARLEPALLPHTHRLLEVLQACRTRTAAAALQRAPEAPLQGARSPPPSANLQVLQRFTTGSLLDTVRKVQRRLANLAGSSEAGAQTALGQMLGLLLGRPDCLTHMASICARLNCLELFPAGCWSWARSCRLLELGQFLQAAGNDSRQFSFAQMLAMWAKQ